MGAELIGPIAMWGAIAFIVLVVLWWAQHRLRASGKREEKLHVLQGGKEQREEFDRKVGSWRSGGGLAGRMRKHSDDDPPPPAA